MKELVGKGMVARQVRIASEDVALLRYLIEAHDGLANLVVDPDGAVSLITTESLARDLDEVLADLAHEISSLHVVRR